MFYKFPPFLTETPVFFVSIKTVIEIFLKGLKVFLWWCLFFSNSQIFVPKMRLKFQPVSQKLMYAPSFSYPQGSTANLWAQTKDQLVVMADKTKPFQARNGLIASYFCRATLHEGFITPTAAKMSLIKTRQFSVFWLLYSLPKKLKFQRTCNIKSLKCLDIV